MHTHDKDDNNDKDARQDKTRQGRRRRRRNIYTRTGEGRGVHAIPTCSSTYHKRKRHCRCNEEHTTSTPAQTCCDDDVDKEDKEDKHRRKQKRQEEEEEPSDGNCGDRERSGQEYAH